ncbi:gas vesicle protein [Leptothoe sp. PORK10 BA2]|uniref:gas vesicle protein n=1 Tax=Leptothoe sp. PORK10 BA2 TaxID=3110254 RepID=UPI002B202D0E|nr:gas vesicle protein [Leptothoe sp. PORK10 BA2]MEA5464099.1 gas vesicle protein [Leptothoe sp. PORK10 BA2]
MSQSSNFTSGFFLGALLGGIVGGVAGVLAASRINQTNSAKGTSSLSQLSEDIRQNLADMSSDERMEVARRGLEDKISELNAAIEEVREQLGTTNGHFTDYETSTIDS